MRYLVILFAAALSVNAQGVNAQGVSAQAPSGEFRFVDLRMTQDGPVAAMMGSFALKDAKGDFNARAAQGANNGAAMNGSLTWSAADSDTAALTGLNGSTLRVRRGTEGMLLGTAAEGGKHELFLAMPKAAALPMIRGTYSGVYLRYRQGTSGSMETNQVVMTIGNNSITGISINGHAVAGDGLNHVVTQQATPMDMGADGTGTIHFATAGEISGDMPVVASGDGMVIAGTNTNGVVRDLLIVARDAGSATEDALTGTFWLAELSGESPYAAQTDALKVSSAEGSLNFLGTGAATINERVSQGAQTIDLATLSRYRLGDGRERMLAPTLTPGLRNMAVAENLDFMISCWAGRAGELTLEHGLTIGVRTPQQSVAAPAPAAITHVDKQPVNGGNPAKPKETLLVNLAALLGPAKPADAASRAAAQVLFNGIPAVAATDPAPTPDQISVTVPDVAAVQGTVIVAVRTPNAYNDVTDIAVLR